MNHYIKLAMCTLPVFAGTQQAFADSGKDKRAADKRPNVIFIMLDDAGYGDFGCYGQTRTETPNIDALARSGIMFTDMYCSASLIKVIRRTDDYAKRYQRETKFKIYLTNPSLRCALFQPITEQDENIGDLVETAVYAQWIPREGVDLHYANWKQGKKEGEVDIAGLDVAKQKPRWAVEVKWTDRYYNEPGELDSLLYFMEKNGLPSAIVTSISESGRVNLERVSLEFIPTACYAYIVGENTIRNTKCSLGL